LVHGAAFGDSAPELTICHTLTKVHFDLRNADIDAGRGKHPISQIQLTLRRILP